MIVKRKIERKMKMISLKVSILLVAFALVAGVNSSCNKYDDTELKGGVSDLNNRVSSLEAWQKQVNSDINSLKSLLGGAETADYITGVKQIIEKDGKTGYEISFKKSPSIAIYNGTNASSTSGSIVGIEKGDNGQFYWTVDGKLLTDGEGHKIPTTGVAPQMRINPATENWEISKDNGVSWEDTGVKATPDHSGQDAIFAPNGVDISSAEYVGFTLADGTTFRVPRYRGIKIGTDVDNGALAVTSATIDIPIELPSGLKGSDYSSIIAEVKTKNGSETGVQTRAAGDMINRQSWAVSLEKPTVDSATGLCKKDAKVRVFLAADNVKGEQAVLEVTLVDNNGERTVASRVLVAQCAQTGVIQINDDGTLGFWQASDDISKVGYFRYNVVLGITREQRISNLPNLEGKANGEVIASTAEFNGVATSFPIVYGKFGFDFEKGIGDPCRLVGLSLDEIKNGRHDNGVWRTPTAYELPSDVNKNCETVSSPYTGTLTNIGYLPSLGCWNNTKFVDSETSNFVYWSSTIAPGYVNEALCFEGMSVGKGEVSKMQTNTMSPIRCVRQ